MRRPIPLACEFVTFIPSRLEERTLYVSIEYGTVVHKCCCGCGKEVVTPLSPTDWKLFYDGVSVSLHPSIGSWNFECKSHYWIDRNTARWAGQWSQKKINAERARDRRAKEKYFTTTEATTDISSLDAGASDGNKRRTGFWGWFLKWWSR